jgi:DNA-binding transcriptional ArsR family regulator
MESGVTVKRKDRRGVYGQAVDRAVVFGFAEPSTGWLTLASDADLDVIFAALADPTRRAILTALMRGDRTVGELARPFETSLAAISKHIQVLAAAGLVGQEKAGRVVSCRVLPEGLRAAGIWLQGVGGFDAEDYDALERLLAAGLREGLE